MTALDGFGDLIERMDHVAFAVHEAEQGARLIRDLGGRFTQGADSPHGAFRWVQFSMPGGAKIELIAPLDAASFLTPFLDDRGEGLHHITFKVTDLDAAVARAAELGYVVVGHQRLHPEWAEAFLHPKGANGTVIQLAEFIDGSISGSADWDAVMAGKVIEGA